MLQFFVRRLLCHSLVLSGINEQSNTNLYYELHELTLCCFAFLLLNKDIEVQVCDATKLDIITIDGPKFSSV